jgi:hypothetical protein
VVDDSTWPPDRAPYIAGSRRRYVPCGFLPSLTQTMTYQQLQEVVSRTRTSGGRVPGLLPVYFRNDTPGVDNV